MKKKIGFIKLRIFSEKATPAPPVGPALGQKGINIIDFCKKFNNYTKGFAPMLLSVKILFYSDKSYDFFCKKPSVSFLIKDLLKVDKINSFKNKFSIDNKSVIDIAKYKFFDFNTNNFYAAFKTVYSTIKSMGILINN